MYTTEEMLDDYCDYLNDEFYNLQRHGSSINLMNMTKEGCVQAHLTIMKMKVALETYMKLRFNDEQGTTE
jgi:hypothetical protein